MTKRERTLAIMLLAFVAVGGGGILLHLLVYDPLSVVSAQVASAEEELIKKEAELVKEERQIDAIRKQAPRLALWRKISLSPMDPEEKKEPGLSGEELKKKQLGLLQVEYEKYLSELLRKNGFSESTISTRPPDRKTAPAVKGKEPAYERLQFGVTGKAKLENVTRALEDFYKTPLLQQVKSLTLNSAPVRATVVRGPGAGMAPPPTGDLEVSMTVEALIVHGAEERSSLTPTGLAAKPRVLAEPGRSYKSITDRHPFLGVASSSRVSEDKTEVLRFVRLTSIVDNGRRWEAWFYDQGKEGEERRVDALIKNTFKVFDRYENIVAECEVIRVDEKELFLKVGDKFYRLRCGEFLGPALESPLSDKEVGELKLLSSGS